MQGSRELVRKKVSTPVFLTHILFWRNVPQPVAGGHVLGSSGPKGHIDPRNGKRPANKKLYCKMLVIESVELSFEK